MFNAVRARNGLAPLILTEFTLPPSTTATAAAATPHSTAAASQTCCQGVYGAPFLVGAPVCPGAPAGPLGQVAADNVNAPCGPAEACETFTCSGELGLLYGAICASASSDWLGPVSAQAAVAGLTCASTPFTAPQTTPATTVQSMSVPTLSNTVVATPPPAPTPPPSPPPTTATGSPTLPPPAACAQPPKETCCTRVLADPSSPLSVRLPAPSALTSVAVWGEGGRLAPPASIFSTAEISVGGGGSQTGCAVVGGGGGAAAASLPQAPPGFATAALVCGVDGDRVLVALPGALPDPSPRGARLVVRVCSAAGNGTSAAALWVQQG